ncbi:MAG: transposase [Planctomycetota bacterium]
MTFTCYRRYPFLAKDWTRLWLAESINAACKKYDHKLWAYVFMPDHVHLVGYPNQAAYDIAEFRKSIKAPVAKQALAHLEQHAPEWLPKVTHKRGSRTERLFWQSGGGHDRNLDQPRTLHAAIDYLHANPARAGLVAKPTDWEWSSAGWYHQQAQGPCVVHPLTESYLDR